VRHRQCGPMRRLMRRGLVGQGNNTIDGHGRQGRDARGPGLVAGEPLSTPSCMKRSCQRQTTVLSLPTARVSAVVPTPSADRTMIRARQTCFCALLRSRMIDCKRARSAGVTSMIIPLHAVQSHSPRYGRTQIRTLPLGAIHQGAGAMLPSRRRHAIPFIDR
jgi:hypothetical protein